ncbi:MAG: hypothetical protein COY80_01895 [Candidatus Pacebacteria bacterium CG_4_10_14_0_8_um_filter_42_14]|nr:MAG: hypothetical protein COY80_01895 [Candidatus Pacebacteria bacterium CG_4_10_14_0_8_um_filter_42_14]
MKSTNIYRSPSFFKGMARTVDIFGKLDAYKYTTDPDSELLHRDWLVTGEDLQDQIDHHEKKPSYQTS